MDAIESKTRQSLQQVVDAGAAGFYASVKSMSALVASGLVLQNATMKDTKGNVATKVTVLGAEYLASPEGTDPATLTGSRTDLAPDAPTTGATSGSAAAGSVTAAGVLTSKDGNTTFVRARMALPKSTAPGRTSSYPTDDLLPPDSQGNLDGFFLEPKVGVKDPNKAYPAIASAANKRWKDKTPTRKFTSRMMDGAPFGKAGVNGCGIFRTE